MSVLPSGSDIAGRHAEVRFVPILLQKSKVASVQIFGQIPKREATDDSYIPSRVTEVAYEFSVSRRGPSDLYRKNAPAALEILDTLCKTTFATISANRRHDRLALHQKRPPTEAALRWVLFDQMKLPSFLSLDASDRAIGRFHVGVSIQRYPDGKFPQLVISNNLNAGDGLTTRPLPDSLKALLAKSAVA
jgi:hypothetical protein